MNAKTKPMYSMFLLLAGAILLLMLYYYAYPMWAALGLRSSLTNSLMLELHRSGSLSSPWSVRFVVLFFTTVSVIVRSGNSKASGWMEIVFPLVFGLALALSRESGDAPMDGHLNRNG